MISVQFGQSNVNNTHHYITSAEWKLPGSSRPKTFQGKADLFIRAQFICLKDSVTSKEYFRFRSIDIIRARRNSKPNHFTIDLNSKAYIKLGSDKSLVTIADLLNGPRG